jgi:hypothetical protein
MEDSPHVSCILLTPYHENDTHDPNFTQPPPDLIDNNKEYEIETIVSHRRKGNQWQFLIKWKGYPTSDNSWENKDNLEHSEETLNEYKEHQGGIGPRKIKRGRIFFLSEVRLPSVPPRGKDIPK